MLRITAGSLKGQQYFSSPNQRVRPTSSIVREAIFNIINNLTEEKNTFLDVFSGTGGMGIEAYSRGFQDITLVDNNIKSINIIKKNTNKLALKNIKIINSDAISFIENTDLYFDFVFMDPPYDYENYDVLIREAKKKAKFVFLEHKKKKKFENVYKYKKWGDTAVSIFLGEK